MKTAAAFLMICALPVSAGVSPLPEPIPVPVPLLRAPAPAAERPPLENGVLVFHSEENSRVVRIFENGDAYLYDGSPWPEFDRVFLASHALRAAFRYGRQGRASRVNLLVEVAGSGGRMEKELYFDERGRPLPDRWTGPKPDGTPDENPVPQP